MPTYVYRCAKCGGQLEVVQSFTDAPLKRHSGGCGGRLAKVMTPVGIVLKGSGFYRNDSGSKKSLSAHSEPKEPASSPSGPKDSGEPSGSGDTPGDGSGDTPGDGSGSASHPPSPEVAADKKTA